MSHASYPTRVGVALAALLALVACSSTTDQAARSDTEPQTVKLAGGGLLDVPQGAIPSGATLQTSTSNPPSVAPGLTSLSDPVDLRISTGAQPRKPATLTYPYDPEQVPDGLTPADVYGVSTYDEADGTWAALAVTFDTDTHTMEATVPSFSWKWPWRVDWAGIGANIGQSVGTLVGKRTDAPACTSSNKLPAWAAAITDSSPAVALRTCAEGDPQDPDIAVFQIVNNRPYGMVLTSPVDLAWSWREDATDPAVMFSRLVMDSALGENQLYLPPVSKASIGVAQGAPANRIFTAEPTAATAFLDVAAQAMTAVGAKAVLRGVAGPFGTACLKPLVEEGAPLDMASVDTYRDFLLGSLPCLQKGLLAAVAAGELDKFKVAEVSSVYKQLGRASKILTVGDLAVNAVDLLVDQLLVAGANTFALRMRPSDADVEQVTPTQEQARAFLGTWAGPVRQENAQAYSARIQLLFTAGALTGSVSYPELGCSGTIDEFTLSSDTLEATETLTQDPENMCRRSGDLRLVIEPDRTLSYEWKARVDGSEYAQATLTRRP